MQILVNGLVTAYERSGTGPVMLVLHGWGDSMQSWRSFATLWSGSYEVILLDLPGFGKSDTPTTAWTLHDYAAFVTAFAQKINAQPAVLVGHSNGGAVAICAVAEQLLAPQHMILLASAGIRDADTAKKAGLRIAAKAAKVFVAPLPKHTQHAIKKRLYGRMGSDLYVAEHMMDTFRNVVGEDVRPLAAKVRTPTLLVYGTADTATPVRYGRMLESALATATFKQIEGAGHFVYDDAPEEVLAVMQEFLA